MPLSPLCHYHSRSLGSEVRTKDKISSSFITCLQAGQRTLFHCVYLALLDGAVLASYIMQHKGRVVSVTLYTEWKDCEGDCCGLF